MSRYIYDPYLQRTYVKSKKTGRKFVVVSRFRGKTGRLYYRLYELEEGTEFEIPCSDVVEYDPRLEDDGG